jgi:hypothetical protein
MLYRRPLHPELFPVVASGWAAGSGATAQIRLIPSGHALHWNYEAMWIEEVLGESTMEMPRGGRLLYQSLDGEHTFTFHLNPRYRYHWCVQKEQLPPEQFWHVHEELVAGLRRGVLFHYQPTHRLHLAPLSVVSVQPVRQGLHLTAFHTFPDEWTIVKSQSLLEQAP